MALASSDVTEEVRRRVRERMIEEKVHARLAIIDSFGKDVYADDQVIAFTHTFPGETHIYKYAAIKVAGKWHTTGAKGKSLTWDELVTWLAESETPVTIRALVDTPK